ncbi:D-alanyl-D-alanine carboxypeptidase [Carboxydothermus islandicus]|uniref:D-alanyl-D-alanine carboxypeptidase n=1 Tax=Carboxydothermus islandicus TaxID=661089 RepID=A0A1L8D541_9THEO|nr:serine hydrolase [Carboxydothermus islandicus]GAV26299.1 D-alanyl-D-alanine carboxypeptidase [Carboxydothermus islandicus]
MRRYFIPLLLWLLTLPVTVHGEIKAKAYYFFIPTTNQIIAAKNQDLPLPPASTTKIATALTALDLYPRNFTLTVKSEAVRVAGTKIYLKPNEKIAVIDLVYGLMLESGNDAANALAWVVGEENFMLILNYYLMQMGLTSVSFKNPSGLSAQGHKISAKDLCVLTYYALLKDEFANICKTKQYEAQSGIKPRVFHNTNRLLAVDSRVIGVKTGTTNEAGKCLVGAWRGNSFLIGAVLNCPDRFTAVYKTFKTTDEKIREKIIWSKGQKIYFKKNDWWTLTKDVKIFSVGNDYKLVKAVIEDSGSSVRALFFLNGAFLSEQNLKKVR